MESVIGKTIKITKGDTFKCVVKPILKSGEDYTIKSGDSISFYIKETLESSTSLVTKEINTTSLLLSILPVDTSTLDCGVYPYFVRLTHSNGDIDTFISGDFILTEGVN